MDVQLIYPVIPFSCKRTFILRISFVQTGEGVEWYKCRPDSPAVENALLPLLCPGATNSDSRIQIFQILISGFRIFFRILYNSVGAPFLDYWSLSHNWSKNPRWSSRRQVFLKEKLDIEYNWELFKSELHMNVEQGKTGRLLLSVKGVHQIQFDLD